MKNKNLLFLDVDGVLNRTSTTDVDDLDNTLLDNLKFLTHNTNPSIVLSSTWRLYKEYKFKLEIRFKEKNIPLWICQTKDLSKPGLITIRSDEITDWVLNNNCENCKILVIDDEKDAKLENLENNKTLFIHTSMKTGLTTEHCISAIKFFNEE